MNVSQSKKTKKSTAVSVIVTVYNMEDYLERCLDSIISQTLKNIEIICIDDSSDDASHEILKKYEKSDLRIKVVTQEHKGAAAARNRGMEIAKGDYLSILDADDFFEPDMLEMLYEKAVNTGADISICKVDEFDQRKNLFRNNDYSILTDRLPGLTFRPADISDIIFNIGCGWAWDKLFKRSFVEEHGIRFQEIRTTNDMFFVYYLYTCAEKISVVDKVLAHHRVNMPVSLSVTREISWDNAYLALKKLKDELTEAGKFEVYHQSFVNWSINLLLWHLRTLKKKEADLLKCSCREEFFEELGLLGLPENYFYNDHEYRALSDILEGMPKVSVIVPVYNASSYLRKCLDSVCAQSLSNIEIICVDDGSEDDSLEILKEYEYRDYRLKVIEKEHSNAGDARNAGMEFAVGEYLSFLDADDFFEPDMLETVYSHALTEEADVCMFRSDQFDNATGEFKDTPWTLRDWEMPASRPFSAEEASEKIFNMSSCTAWDKLFRRDFIFDNFIIFQGNHTSNDMVFTYTSIALANRIFTVDKVLAHQRIRHKKSLAKDIDFCMESFSKALFGLKVSLTDRDLYEKFKISYVNWALDYSLFNLHAFKGILSEMIRQQLKLKLFRGFDITDLSEEDFYDKAQYNEMLQVAGDDAVSLSKRDKPLFSVIIPVDEEVDHYPLAINSVLCQTFTDIEIMIVNAGIKESLSEEIQKYAAGDDRVSIYGNYCGGYGSAVSKAISAATGEYISIIDQSDYLSLEAYKVLSEIIRFFDAPDVIGGYFDKFDNNLRSYPAGIDNELLVLNSYSLPELYSGLSDETLALGACVIKRSFLEGSHIGFTEELSCKNAKKLFVSILRETAEKIFVTYERFYHIRTGDKKSEVRRFDELISDIKVLTSLLSGKQNKNTDYIQKELFDTIREALNSKEFYERREELKQIIIDSMRVINGSQNLTKDEKLIYETYKEYKNPSRSKKASPKVSVIVPVYNTKDYLRQCIKSLCKQTLTDIEIICVDDGSTDDSPAILDRLTKRDKRIKVIHKKNAGYGHTLNVGIKYATGQYIGVVDSDDYVSAEMYENLYSLAKKNDLDFIKSDFYEIRTYRDRVYRRKISGFAGGDVYNNVLDPAERKDSFNYVTMNVWTGLFKKEFLSKKNIRFHESPGAAFQDSGFWFQTLCMADRVMFTDKAFYRYRKDNPKSSVNDRNKVYDIVKEYAFIKRFLISHPKQYKIFFDTFVFQRYYAYMDAYTRIGEEFRLDFLKKCAEEFYEDLSVLEEKERIEDMYAFSEMLRIIDSPEMYYYESRLDEYNRSFEEVCKDLEMCKAILNP